MGSLQQVFKRAKSALKLFGLDPDQMKSSLTGLNFFLADYKELKRQKGNNSSFQFGKLYPVLNERSSESGTMGGHYFHQDLYVARKIFANKPVRHIDIGSRTDGFVAHVASFREIEIIDIRAQKGTVKNISFRQADLMQLPPDLIDSCDSISSLHVIEHFGLGRYGDPIDYFGYKKAIQNIKTILQQNGTFYFSVPIGPQRIEFNAQRVFSVRFLVDLLKVDFEIKSFSYIDDDGEFYEEIPFKENQINLNYGCYYGCGIFELIKK